MEDKSMSGQPSDRTGHEEGNPMTEVDTWYAECTGCEWSREHSKKEVVIEAAYRHRHLYRNSPGPHNKHYTGIDCKYETGSGQSDE